MTEPSLPEESIFAQALEISSVAERAAFLDRACGNNQALRAQVEALLRAHERSGDVLDRPQQLLLTTDLPGHERPGTMLGPYKLLEQIGEGGMGTVWMAEQTQPIQRRVAVKVVKAGMDSRQVLARFEAERQALALMEHPNIARVLDAGQTPSGRPYFVMELVKGKPITTYCDEKRLAVRERLELFGDVCRAVQHAHQKGIIHRDLKPSNVLVAPYDGRPVVKVIDFGVAKATGQRLTDKTLFTGFGALVGTPEYMSPEQAEVNNQDIDTRSDIYSLGVLLYELLTGSTPLTHKRLKDVALLEVLRLIREEEAPRPSTRLSESKDTLPSISAQRQTDPAKLTKLVRGELDWIVMTALEKDRNRRYETANGLAMDAQRYLADEPVLACPPSAAYQLRKFLRRYKGPVLAASVIVLLLAVLAGSIGWVARDAAARRAETVRVVTSALEESASWQKQRQLLEALSAARRAEGLLAGAEVDESLRQRVRSRLADLELLDSLENVRLEKLTEAKGGDYDKEGADSLYGQRFRGAGLDVEALPVEEAGQRIGRSTVATELAAVLDQWASVRREIREVDDSSWKDLLQLARLVDPDVWRTRVREALERRDRRALLALASSEEVFALAPATLSVLGNALGAEKESRTQAEAFLRKAQRLHPHDFWLNENLRAFFHAMQPPQADEELRFAAVAVALRPGSPGAHFNLGNALYDNGQLDEAIAEWHEALRLQKALQQDLPQAHTNLGIALRDKGLLDEAIAEHREAIRLKKDAAAAHTNLGGALRAKGLLDEAIAEHREAIRLQKDLPQAHNNLAVALRDKGLLDEAIAAFREAIRIKQDFAGARNNLGGALRDKGLLDEAIAEYREAIRLQKDYADAHNNLGNALADKGRLDEAIAEYRQAIQIKKDDASAHNNLGAVLKDKGLLDEAITEHREAIRLKKDFAEAHNNLGIALKDKGLLDEAIAEFRQAIRIKKDDSVAHTNLGSALDDKGLLDEAIAEHREALRLKKDYAGARNNLGVALRRKGQLDEAIAAHREAIRIKKDYAEAHNNLGADLADKRLLDEAIAAFRKAIRIKKDYAEARNNLGVALRNKGQLDEAVAEYREAIRLKKDSAEAHINLGNALYDKRQLDEAIAEYREAIRLKKDFVEAHNNLGNALRKKGLLDEAIAECLKAIRIKKDYAEPHYNLGNALRDKGQVDEAIAEFRDAVRIKKDYAEAHCNLGLLLMQQGRFWEAVEELRRGNELGSRNPRWPYPSRQWLHQAQERAKLDDRLSGVLEGKDQPRDTAERLGFAELCQLHRKRYAATAGFYERAFANEPKLAEDMRAGHRYNAACAAALAGCGQGKDADKLDVNKRARLRRQALDWLRADLDAWGEQLNKEPDRARPVLVQQMRHWQADTDFSGVRGPQALAQLPEAERKLWQKLWDDVANTLARAQGKTTPEKKSGAK
jgi:tetratricopeptide (TPR) repeat protein/serine/threonine protein kinase